ncbi:hypothetical protein BJ508DRAFT_114794 [Ascobolus immersus RN42]|uniref:RRM domain-containing protein n=1 Tax=Ascobolus immersus RN42 TaxID=1160509 RepID=A0A3N4I536_ASCIM|nr:hypothetical protein BJ508DRAFT_114794 [Ascobolus immersus RN42]
MSEITEHSSPAPEDEIHHDTDSSSTFPPTPLQTNAREGLSPVSPRPLHVTEPSSVPVLENQMDPAFIKTGEPTANAVEALDNLQTANLGDDSEVLDTGASNTILYDPASTASIPEPKDTTMGENEDHTEDSTNNQNTAETNESSPTTNGAVNYSAHFSPTANSNTSPTTTASQAAAIPASLAAPSLIPSDLQLLLSQLSPETLKVASPATPATTTTLPLLPTHPPSSQPQLASSPSATASLPVAIAPASAPNLPPNPLTGTHSLPAAPTNNTTSNNNINNNPPPSLPKPPHVRPRSMSQSSSVEDEGEGKPFSPEEEKAYEEFLSEEREYVSKGQWDRFPAGSRLFIGNLPTEKVTKRDLFRIFSRHGRLAQISIKQAFGFIQFLDVSSCHSAIKGEEGTPVRGRRMHLEVSKPQKNTRQERRRTRSPDARGPLSPRPSRSDYRERDRYPDRDRHYRGDDRGPPRGRDDDRDRDRDMDRGRGRDSYRGGRDRDEYRRSPPPRMRRDDYRPSRDRTRSRTPPSRYRSRSPADSLAIPRRAPHEIPEVQFIVTEKLHDEFIYYVREPFHKKKIKNDVLYLSPRIPLDDVIRRQILEGVLAVGILNHKSETTGKFTMQVFDRRGGESNVRFETYDDLAPEIAGELVDRVKLQTGASYRGYPQPQIVSPYGAPMAMPAAMPQANMQDMLKAFDPAMLQQFLGNMQQMGGNPALIQQQLQQMQQMQQAQQQQQQQHQQHQPQSHQQHSRQNSQQMYGHQPEPAQPKQQQMQASLASLLASRGAVPQPQSQQSAPQQSYGGQQGYPPNLATLLASANASGSGQPGQVNNLLETLAQLKR